MFRVDIPDQTFQLFIAGKPDTAAQEFRSQPLSLEPICDQHRKLGLIGSPQLDDTPYTDDLVLPGLWVVVLRDQRHFPIIVDKTDADQPFVSCALAQLEHVQPAKVDRALR